MSLAELSRLQIIKKREETETVSPILEKSIKKRVKNIFAPEEEVG